MKKYLHILLIITFYVGSLLCSYAQTQKSSSKVEQELKLVIDEWVQNANNKDYEAMRDILTDDFYLFQNGRRYNKDEYIQFIRDIEIYKITYKTKNNQSGSGGNIAFLTFDLEMQYKQNENPKDSKALSTYIFRKEINKWKMQAKSNVMVVENKN